MAKSVTARMRRARRAFWHLYHHGPLTNLQLALRERVVGTHVRTQGAVAHRPGRSRLGATHTVHLCPGRCGVPVAHDMQHCAKHRMAHV